MADEGGNGGKQKTGNGGYGRTDVWSGGGNKEGQMKLNHER